VDIWQGRLLKLRLFFLDMQRQQSHWLLYLSFFIHL
jgi:hypothetical protein